jgi:uncharacterized protein (DUF488 family)
MMPNFTTIGHSTRDIADFLAILSAAQVSLLIDVRSFPSSRAYPAYNRLPLAQSLEAVQIAYRHCSALGGRRGRQPHIDPQRNGLWRLPSFHNYADYALGPEFAAALGEIEAIGAHQRLTLMCAEAVWWRCHRRIITDYLLAHGHVVVHLLGLGQSQVGELTSGAWIIGDKVVYPATNADDHPKPGHTIELPPGHRQR